MIDNFDNITTIIVHEIMKSMAVTNIIRKPRAMYQWGREANIDPYTFIPKFTVQRLFMTLSENDRRKVLVNCKALFGCHSATFQRIRYAPMVTPEGKADVKPQWEHMTRIADYFGVPLDALRNRSKQPMLLHPQLPFTPTPANDKKETAAV